MAKGEGLFVGMPPKKVAKQITKRLLAKRMPNAEPAPPARGILQTKTVSGQALENQRVYI